MVKKTQLLSELTDDELNLYIFYLREHIKLVVVENEKRKQRREKIKELGLTQ